MSVWTVDADEARRLAEQDPAVVAGRFRVDVARWAVAAGRITFPRAGRPRWGSGSASRTSRPRPGLGQRPASTCATMILLIMATG